MFWQVEGLLWSLLVVLEETRLDQELQQATDAPINGGFCHLAPLDGLQQLLSAPAWRRHLQIQPSIEGSGGALDREKPVGDHDPIKAPFPAQNLG